MAGRPKPAAGGETPSKTAALPSREAHASRRPATRAVAGRSSDSRAQRPLAPPSSFPDFPARASVDFGGTRSRSPLRGSSGFSPDSLFIRSGPDTSTGAFMRPVGGEVKFGSSIYPPVLIDDCIFRSAHPEVQDGGIPEEYVRSRRAKKILENFLRPARRTGRPGQDPNIFFIAPRPFRVYHSGARVRLHSAKKPNSVLTCRNQ